jgi:NADH-ubiquinone oxidoreductase chain 5
MGWFGVLMIPTLLTATSVVLLGVFAAPTIIKLIPIPFSTLGAFVAYNVNLVADQFQRAFQSRLSLFLVTLQEQSQLFT